jgi:hypothetical protein
LKPVVTTYNTALEKEGYKLELIRDDISNTDNRRAIQVVLNENDSELNLLNDPYLLIEGNVMDGQIRIVRGRSTNEGHVVNVKDINSKVIQSELTDFLSEAI